MTTYAGFRIFIGPGFSRSDAATYYDWSGIAGGTAAILTAQTTLAATLADGATSATLASAANLPPKGGLFVGPNGSGQGWEYIPYASLAGSVVSGLVRESADQREHNGTHSAGAVVRTFYELSKNDGRLSISYQTDASMVSATWSAEIGGIGAPQIALRPYHLCVIQTRTTPTGTWSNYLIGFLDRSTIQDDHRRAGVWSARIISLAGVLGRIQTAGVRVGLFDAGLHGSAQSSAPLASAHKERHAGDYVAADPSFDAQNVLSEDDGIWIAEELVGTPEPVSSSYDGFTQLYINPPPVLNYGYRWIEWINRENAGSNLWVYDAVLDQTHSVDLPDQTLADGERAVLAEDAAKYAEMNPVSTATVIDVRNTGIPTLFNAIRASGGAIGWSFNDVQSDTVVWGTVSSEPTGWDWDWVGPALAAPAYDQTMRYLPLATPGTNSNSVWSVGRTQSPGYQIKNDGDDAWLYVELPGMQLVLAEDITNTTPGSGATLKIVDATGGYSTDGLPANGTLQIGDEQISYSAKVAEGVTVSGRGVNSTTAAAHSAGDAIFLRHVWAGRTMITDAMPIDKTTWIREGGTIYPADFVLRWSALPASTPAETEHEGDYEEVQAVTGHSAATYTKDHLAGFRARSFVFEFKKMTTDPARPRLNRVIFEVQRSEYAAARWIASGQTIGQLISQIAQNAGIASALITVTAGTLAPDGFSTAIDTAWAVIVSAAEMAGAYVESTANGRLSVAPDSFWITPVSSLSVSHAWTRANVAEVELVRTSGGAISQAKLAWETPDGTTKGIAKYPATPDPIGTITDLGSFYYATQGAADLAARRRFVLNRYPHEWMIVPAEGDLSILPRRVGSITWQIDPAEPEMDRLILLRQVDHIIQNEALETVCFGVQVDREDHG